MNTTRSLLSLLIAFGLAAGSASALAQQPGGQPTTQAVSDARVLFLEGQRHKREGDELAAAGKQAAARTAYGEAARKYLDAYQLSKAPRLLYNLAQVYRLRGETRWALQIYRKFVELAPDDVAAEQARTFIAELERKDTEGVTEGGGDTGLDPAAILGEQDPASASSAGSAETLSDSVDNSARDDVRGGVPLVTSTDRDSRGSGGRTTYRIAAWATLAATVLSGTLAARLHFAVIPDREEEAESLAASVGVTGSVCSDAARSQSAQLDDVCGDGEAAALQGNILQGATLGLAVVAGFLFYKGYLSGGRDREQAAVTSFTPLVGPHEVGAQLGWRF
ncbi:MAG: tetratricopeptide repeat protein [Myxococcota bacterium]